MTVYFISDTHFGHANVIKYSKRPFADVEEMNEALIANWNAVVKRGDRVYHLGDFSFVGPEVTKAILSRLTGEIHLIRGNHDYHMPAHVENLFASVRDLHMVKIDGQKVFLSHYAMRTWESSHHGSWNLHGHSHGTLPRLEGYKQADMGVDCWGYRPVPFEEIQAQMDAIEFLPVDHHGV
jgi:calcineurin-like phosphoesterase family protein